MDKRVITNRAPRRRHSEALKRELVERSLQPGASVAALAQEHGINANLLFNWRRLHMEQQQAAAQLPVEPAPVLLPVTVEEPVAALAAVPACAPTTPTPRRAGTGVIEVEIGAALVRLRVSGRCAASLPKRSRRARPNAAGWRRSAASIAVA